MVYDGSYMRKVDPTIIYSTVFLIRCIFTVGKSDFVDNYRAGCLGYRLYCGVPHSLCRYCDNLGIVWHADKPNELLPEKQSEGGTINLIKKYQEA